MQHTFDSKYHFGIFLFVVLLIFTLSACSFSLKSAETRQTETAMAMPTDTKTPMPTETETPIPTETMTPIGATDPVLDKSSRWAPFPGSEYYVGDLDNDMEWDVKIQVHATSLGIPNPYYYELYALPPNTSVEEVDAYVAENCTEYRAFPGDQNIYLYRGLGEVDGFGEMGYNVQHWADGDVIMILYFTPDDYYKSMVR